MLARTGSSGGSKPRLWYRFKKWFALYPGMVKPVSAAFLSGHYADRRSRRARSRKAVDLAIGAAFKLWVPIRARSVARKFGLNSEWRRRAARIARERFADPNDLALFRIERAEELDAFMRRFEHAAINKVINPRSWEAGCALADKIGFAERCKVHGLPHPELLATIVDGKAHVRQAPATDSLVLKPNNGEGGSGFQLLDYPGATGDADAFRAFLEGRFGGLQGQWLIQPRLRNDESMKDLAMSALATVRVTTMLAEDGTPEIVTSVLRFPSSAESPVDNIKAGGLMAAVDLDSGRLEIACRGRGLGEYERHPITGAQIEGRILPFWAEARALVVDAHRKAFSEYVLVGWDVALTPSGPILIEGNGKPCLIVAQRASRKGLGQTRFGALIEHHLQRASQ